MQIEKYNANIIARGLRRFSISNPVVLALQPESSGLAQSLSKELKAPAAEYLSTWEIQISSHSPVVLASVAEDGTAFLARRTLELLQIKPEELDSKILQSEARARELARRIRNGRPLNQLNGKTAILVAAPGISVEAVGAAELYLRKRAVHSILLVAERLAIATAEQIRKRVSHLFCTRIVPSTRALEKARKSQMDYGPEPELISAHRDEKAA